MKTRSKRPLRLFITLTALLVVSAVTAGLTVFLTSASEDRIDLTTVDPSSVSVGWGNLCVDRGLDGKEIDMSNDSGGTTVFEHGFTAHASSALEFDISGYPTAKAFIAYIGAEHAASNGYTGSTSIAFRVYADGVLLYESGTFHYNTPCERVFVRLPDGTRILKLVTDDLGSNTGDHSAWGSPELYVGDLDLEGAAEIEVSTDHLVYPAHGGVALSYVCRSYLGAEITPDSVVYASSDPTVATVASDGTVMPAGKSGRVTVTATASHRGSDASGKLELSFLAPESDAGTGCDVYDLSCALPDSAVVGWGALHVNSDLDNGKIELANGSGGTTVYEHGFTAHASSQLDFDLTQFEGAAVFTAFIGAEHSSNAYAANTSIRFVVKADGVTLYESDVFSYDTPAKEIFVTLPAGTQTLTLVTDDCGGNIGDHSAWGAPRFYVGDFDPHAIRDVVFEDGGLVYPAGASALLSAKYYDYTGAEITPDAVSFSSSDGSVASVDASGLITSSARGGRVDVMLTATKNGRTASASRTFCFAAPQTDASAGYGAYIDLCGIDPSFVKVGWGDLHINEGLDGNSIDLSNGSGGTTVYAHGITAHASSSLDFDISKLDTVRLFSAHIGVEHSPSNALSVLASISFSVWADGVKLYESPILGYNDEAPEIFVLIPAGTSVLTLKTDAGSSNYGDHSAWGAPRLLVGENAEKVFRTLEVSSEKQVYLTGETFNITAVCRDLSGAQLVPDSLSFASSAPAVASVDSSGRVTVRSAGDAAITVTAVKNGIEKSETLELSFMDEVDPRSFTVSSPDGSVTVDLGIDEQGRVYYSVLTSNCVRALERSYIGFKTDRADFSAALRFLDESAERRISSSYTTRSGKNALVIDRYNEKTFRFVKGDYIFGVIFRLYDDGFAYRFKVDRADGTAEELTVLSETSTFKLPESSKIYAEFISTLTSTFCYETGYSEADTATVPTPYICMPATVRLSSDGILGDTYMLLSEADYFSDVYPGSLFTYDAKAKDGSMGITRAPLVTVQDVVTVTTSFTSPWRFGIVGDLKTLFESDMTEKLNPPAVGDFSWVTPGVTAWMWLSEGYGGQRNESTIREYIDMASEMGWKYLILDEGWQPSSKVPGKVYDGYFDYFEDLISYAESKGVGFIVWVKYCDLDTPEEREVLVEWANMGIKGIKADFFDNENADTLAGYRAIYEKCAENRLLLNCHGASKPTGERRTWPCVINREAVNGEEGGGLWLENAMYWAYARGIVGPIDITPRLYSTGGNTTTAQMACNIVFESGMPCMASDSADYLNFSANSFYKDLPAAWDETLFLEGGIGEYVCTARRAGKNWYVGAMSSGARSLSLSLDFLGGGSYTAYVYSDLDRKNVEVTVLTVTSADTLSAALLSKGGYAVKFVKNGSDFDIDGNGEVNIVDVSALLDALSLQGSSAPYDLDGDGVCSIGDVSALLDELSKQN